MKKIFLQKFIVKKIFTALSLIMLIVNMSFLAVFVLNIGGTPSALAISSEDDMEDNATDTIEPSVHINPTLDEACGLDIVLVLDSSGSMTNNDIADVKAAANSFVNTLVDRTPTKIGVVDFDTHVNSSLAPTNNVTDIANAINSIVRGGFTNWEQAIDTAQSLLAASGPNPDLLVMITDGNPTTDDNSVRNIGQEHEDDLFDAIAAANDAKDTGTRMLAIGIDSHGVSASGLDTENLKKITNGDDSRIAPPNAVDAEADVVLADVGDLAAALADLATGLCGGTVNVKKYVDNILSPDWEFSAITDLGTLDKESGITDADGFVSFSLSDLPGIASVTITETPQNGFVLASATCYDENGEAVGSLNGLSVENIAVGENNTITCEFYNEINENPTGDITVCKYNDINANGIYDAGDYPLSGWGISLIGDEIDDIETETEYPDGCVVFNDLPLGSYVVAEELLPDLWTPTIATTALITLSEDENTANVVFLNKMNDCGDEYLDDNEECDDGNNIDGDGCDAQCNIEENTNEPYCGDGNLDTGEECDDGNNTDGDGCSAQCVIEETEPDHYCGDGNLDADETCDDGNNIDGDGCNHQCQRESGNNGGGSVPTWFLSQNNESTGEESETESAPEPVVLGAQGEPKLVMEKSVNKTVINPGEELEYKIVVANNGNMAAFNVVLTDTLPDGFSYVEDAGASKTWDIGDIAVGAIKTFTYTVKAANNIDGGKYVNKALLTADNNPNVTAIATVNVEKVAVLAETGFDINEFLLLVLSAIFFMSTAAIIRKKQLI